LIQTLLKHYKSASLILINKFFKPSLLVSNNKGVPQNSSSVRKFIPDPCVIGYNIQILKPPREFLRNKICIHLKNLAIPCLLLLAACSKSIDQQQPSIINNEKETCSFGLSEFNMVKRPAINIEMSKGKPGGGGGNGSGGSGGSGTTGGGTTPTTTSNVILLDFNGEYVTNTMWNVNGPITCAPANLNAEEAGVILQRVTTDFTPFNITVTTDEAVYNAANPLKRMRVIIT
jgi:hypothetical protein